MGEGAVHWLAGANQPAQPAKPARPPHTRVHLPPRARTRPRRARPTVSGQRRRVVGMRARRRHDLPLRLWTALARSPFSPPPRAHPPAFSLALSPPPVSTAPSPAIGAPRAPSSLFPMPRRLPAPPSTSPSSTLASACSDVLSSRR